MCNNPSRPLITDLFPLFRFGASQYSVADGEFVVAILEGTEVDFFACAADIGIDPEEKILQAVGIGLGMAAGIMGVTTGAFAEKGRIFHEQLIWLLAIANPHFIRPFLVPYD